MHYYLGLLFEPSSVHFQKIKSFKQRYDLKFNSNPFVELTILPPFEIDFKNQNSFKSFSQDLNDLIDGHLLGLKEVNQIEFNGINMAFGKSGIISLTPKLSIDLHHLKCALYAFLKEEGAIFKGHKENLNLFLPIGRCDYEDQLEFTIAQAKIEFSSPFVLNAKELVLFERNHYVWNIKYPLFKFNNNFIAKEVHELWLN